MINFYCELMTVIFNCFRIDDWERSYVRINNCDSHRSKVHDNESDSFGIDYYDHN